MSLMLQEIGEQPDALEKTIAEEREKIRRVAESVIKKDVDLIVLVARGSSDNAALFGRYLLEITTGIPVSLSAPSVHTLYDAKLNLRRALVIGVSQSAKARTSTVSSRTRARVEHLRSELPTSRSRQWSSSLTKPY